MGIPTTTTLTTTALVTPLGVAGGLAVLLVACLIYGLRKARGTTLWAPCVWALVATVGLALEAGVESLPENSEQGIGLSALRFAVAAGTLCPLMAVLGAKRPQNRGWQWVVLTLWIVLVWPAVQAVLMPTGLHLELFVVWKMFLIGLVAVGLFNYLPTSNWPAACLVSVGQVILLDSSLWQWEFVDRRWALAAGLGCFLGAAFFVLTRNYKKRWRVESAGVLGLAEFDRSWLDFRDAFGALWALRVLARVNHTAEISQWPMRLAWSGFIQAEAEAGQAGGQEAGQKPTAEQLGQLQTTMETLLRRFV